MIVRTLGSRQRANDLRAEVGRIVQPATHVPMPMPALPGLLSGVGQIARGVGQAAQAACPVFPSTLKYISDTTASLTALTGTETLVFSTPGAFCPMKMFVIGSIDSNDILVQSIKSGLEEQIILGDGATGVPGDLFGIANDCCPTACLKCICSPGVTYEVTVQNLDAMAQTVTVILVGSYRDACPPGARPEDLMPSVPGCPMPGSDKLLAFAATLAAGVSDSLELTTPGKFCPRQMFVGASGQPGDISITGIVSGLRNQIISGTLPATLFGTDNECCILACFDCLCAPGYPLFLNLTNNDGANPSTIRGVLVGSYEDGCP